MLVWTLFCYFGWFSCWFGWFFAGLGGFCWVGGFVTVLGGFLGLGLVLTCVCWFGFGFGFRYFRCLMIVFELWCFVLCRVDVILGSFVLRFVLFWVFCVIAYYLVCVCLFWVCCVCVFLVFVELLLYRFWYLGGFLYPFWWFSCFWVSLVLVWCWCSVRLGLFASELVCLTFGIWFCGFVWFVGFCGFAILICEVGCWGCLCCWFLMRFVFAVLLVLYWLCFEFVRCLYLLFWVGRCGFRDSFVCGFC